MKQGDDRLDKTTGAVDRLSCLRRAHLRLRPSLVISESFETVGAPQERPQVLINRRLSSGQVREFRLNAGMRFRRPPNRLENEALRRVETRKLSGAPGVVLDALREKRGRPIDQVARLFQVSGCFWFHRSTPSRRISCIRGVRS